MAVGVDSVRYEGFYRCLFFLLGLEYENTIIQKQHKEMDAKWYYNIQYLKREEVMKKKSEQKSIKIHQQLKEDYDNKKKGFVYQLDIAGRNIHLKRK